MAVRDELKTPFGNLHGGVMAGLVDHVLGVVAYPLMRRGQWAATTEFKLNYLTAVSDGHAARGVAGRLDDAHHRDRARRGHATASASPASRRERC